MSILVVLDYPPTANNLFRNVPGKGRAKTDRYKAWLMAATWTIKAHRHKPLDRYRLTIVATRPDNLRRDLDNLIKPISDALVMAGLIKDHLAQSILITWSDAAPDPAGGVRVQLDPAG